MNQAHHHDPFQSNQNVGNFLNPNRSCIRLYNPGGVFAANKAAQKQFNNKVEESNVEVEAQVNYAKADFEREAARVPFF